MTIKQIYDKPLAHGSYAIESNGKVALVDPGRDPQPYIDFAQEHNAKIVAVFETHPHADFTSSHLEFQKNFGAKIYVHPKVGVTYEYEKMEHNDEVTIGDIRIRALFTPGHSPDHNSYLLMDKEGHQHAVFTGDSLFVGDVGRPDLREGAGNIQVSKLDLAEMMFDTINSVFTALEDDVIVYPAHGAGSLCGKNMSSDLQSTIGREKKQNWAFQFDDKEKFVESYLDGQPFIPKYFPHDVELNREGLTDLTESLAKVSYLLNGETLDEDLLVIDVRSEDRFKKGHLKGAINIQNGENHKFETWLGSIVGPDERFYITADTKDELRFAVMRAAKIGYESNVKGAVLLTGRQLIEDKKLDLDAFKENTSNYTIVDIRNKSEVEDGKIFDNAINIPLHELRERADEISENKLVVVHCAGGYRSAAGASILADKLNTQVYDLSDAIQEFKENAPVK